MMLPSDRRREIVLRRLTELGRIGPGARVSIESMSDALKTARPGTPLSSIYREAFRCQRRQERIQQRNK
jgi:hypothetical protein